MQLSSRQGLVVDCVLRTTQITHKSPYQLQPLSIVLPLNRKEHRAGIEEERVRKCTKCLWRKCNGCAKTGQEPREVPQFRGPQIFNIALTRACHNYDKTSATRIRCLYNRAVYSCITFKISESVMWGRNNHQHCNVEKLATEGSVS